MSNYSPEILNLLKTIHSFHEQWSAWTSSYPYQAVRVKFIASVCGLVPSMLLYVQMGLEIPLFGPDIQQAHFFLAASMFGAETFTLPGMFRDKSVSCKADGKQKGINNYRGVCRPTSPVLSWHMFLIQSTEQLLHWWHWYLYLRTVTEKRT